MRQCESCDEPTDEEMLNSRGICEECMNDADADFDGPDYEDRDYPIDGVGFADPGGRSALRAATASNPRNLPCPTCGSANRLTPADAARSYQCDGCADADEGYVGSNRDYSEPFDSDNWHGD